jgi:hypothetical protein
MQNLAATFASQYANSPTLVAWLTAINAWIDNTAALAQFVAMYLNINTASGAGLDRIGRVVGVPRVMTLTAGQYFGWSNSTGGDSGDSWGSAGASGGALPWYTGPSSANNYALTDTAYRQVLLAKAALNITDGSVPATNAILQRLFVTDSFVPGRTGQAFVVDGCNMTMEYFLNVSPALTPVEGAILAAGNLFPKPTGVSVSTVT